MAFVPVGMVRLQLLQIGVCSALVSVPMTHLPENPETTQLVNQSEESCRIGLG
jgi:hypothetical protein